MNIKRSGIVLSAFLLFAVFPAWAQNPHCEQVGGVLMTNIGAIKVPSPQGTNLGPVFGDLAGSVAATILGQNQTAPSTSSTTGLLPQARRSSSTWPI